MSEGPIKRARDAWKPPAVSMSNAERICAPNIDRNRAYCGRSNKRTAEWEHVNCADCLAAARADKDAR